MEKIRTNTSVNNLRSSYNRCINIFNGFNRRDSFNILVILGLPSFDTVMANATMSYSRLWNSCGNRIVMHLLSCLCVKCSNCPQSTVQFIRVLCFCVFLCCVLCSFIFCFVLLWALLPELKWMMMMMMINIPVLRVSFIRIAA